MTFSMDIDGRCFVCGRENPHGLHARFTCEEGVASARFEPRPEHQGYAGVTHGGILMALLDESMVYAAVSLGNWVATGEMTIRFHRPAPTGEALEVSARVASRRRRLVECAAEVRTLEGELIASATGKLVQGRPFDPVELARGNPPETPPPADSQ